MTPLRAVVTSGLDVLQVVVGASLLSIIAYRVYNKRPQLDVPRTDAQIRDYKRTGVHPGAAGFSGYHIVYGTPFPWLLARLIGSTAVALAVSLVLRRYGHRHPGATLDAVALGCGMLALYGSLVAWAVLYEFRRGRHARLERLLDALDLPEDAHVLAVESLPGLLGIAAARRLPKGHAEIVAPDAATREATQINLRRAGVASHASVGEVPSRLRYDVILREAPGPAIAAARTAIMGYARRGATLPGRKLASPVPARLLRRLTLGLIAPQASVITTEPD